MKADAFAALLTSVRQAGTIRRGESESSRGTARCPTEATHRRAALGASVEKHRRSSALPSTSK
jgi:hypothetical protein